MDFTDIVDAGEHFKDVFGHEIPELEQGAAANAIRGAIQKHDKDVQEVFTALVQHGLPGADILKNALDQMRAISTGKEEQVIKLFKNSFRDLKEAIKRTAELSQVLTEPTLHDLARAQRVRQHVWPVLEQEPDLDEMYREHEAKVTDLLARATFFRELPAIDQHAHALEQEHARLHQEAANARIEAYQQALQRLRNTPGWDQLDQEQQQRIAKPLLIRADPAQAASQTIPLLQADMHACPGHLAKAVQDMLGMVDGNRIVTLDASNFFSGGVGTEEQLEQAVSGLREQCLELIGAGKKVLVQ